MGLSPAELILENNGIGYRILISLQTYQRLENRTETTVYIHHYLREDSEQYYGFATKDERELFELLISVSGIGVTSARMMLSSLSTEEICHAILSEDVARIKTVKGIGLKSAQRMVLELKDKIAKGDIGDSNNIFGKTSINEAIEEATRALIMLGFTKQAVTKAVQAVIKEKPDAKVEEIIKLSLQMM